MLYDQYLNGVIAGKASQIGDLFAVIYIVIYLRLVIKALKVLVGDLQIFKTPSRMAIDGTTITNFLKPYSLFSS